jgi:hypothetical protein
MLPSPPPATLRGQAPQKPPHPSKLSSQSMRRSIYRSLRTPRRPPVPIAGPPSENQLHYATVNAPTSFKKTNRAENSMPRLRPRHRASRPKPWTPNSQHPGGNKTTRNELQLKPPRIHTSKPTRQPTHNDVVNHRNEAAAEGEEEDEDEETTKPANCATSHAPPASM